MGKCTPALLAALELLQEECKGEKGVYKAIADGVIIYVPEEFIKEFESSTGHKFGNPIVDEDVRRRAIEACKRAPWARHLAEKMVGVGAPPEVLEMMAEKLCRGLIE